MSDDPNVHFDAAFGSLAENLYPSNTRHTAPEKLKDDLLDISEEAGDLGAMVERLLDAAALLLSRRIECIAGGFKATPSSPEGRAENIYGGVDLSTAVLIREGQKELSKFDASTLVELHNLVRALETMRNDCDSTASLAQRLVQTRLLGEDELRASSWFDTWALYWVESEDHGADWFVVAGDSAIAAEFFASMENYEPREVSRVEYVTRVYPAALREYDERHPPVQQFDEEPGAAVRSTVDMRRHGRWATYPDQELFTACEGEIVAEPLVDRETSAAMEQLGVPRYGVRFGGQLYFAGTPIPPDKDALN